MRWRSMVPGLLVVAMLSPGAARASGAWQTHLRPTVFNALLAHGDTVWCASRDAGLLRYTPSRREFSPTTREPNGLASNRLSSLVFDARGRLWVGTLGSGASVLSADGAGWSLVNAFDGLPSDSVNTVVVDGDTLWIGTTRGLALWDGHQVSGVLPDGINPSPFASDNITGVIVEGDTLWVSTRAGVYIGRLSQGLSSWTTANAGLGSLRVDRMLSDSTSHFLLAALTVYRWNPGSATWVAVGTGGGGIGAVRSLNAAQGTVLAGTDTGLYRWAVSTWIVLNAALPSSADSPLLVTLDETGRAWAAGRPGYSYNVSGTGLYSQPAGGAAGPWSFDLPSGPPSNSCLNLDIEADRVYVTTFGQGIGRLQGARWTYWFPGQVGNTSPTTFRRPSYPYAMLIDKHSRKWFFCWAPYSVTGVTCVPDTGVLDILTDPSNVDHVSHHLLGPNPAEARYSFARASTADSNGGAWFGLDSPCGEQADLAPAGLLYYSDSNFVANYNSSNPRVHLPSDLVLSLVTDRNKRVWIGTGKGLCYFDDTLSTGEPDIHRVSGTETYSVRGLATRRDSLWIYESGNVHQYSLAPSNRGSYNIPGGPSLNAVRPMDVGLDGTLWLGTSNGIRAYTRGGGFTDYTSANSPLADNEVRTIRVDHATGQVWIATASGLNRFDPFYVAPGVRLPSLAITLYPNPLRLSQLGIPVRLSGKGADYTGAIFDLNGRRVNHFAVRGNDRIVWNGRDEHGELVPPGIYFVRAESGGRSAVSRIVLLR